MFDKLAWKTLQTGAYMQGLLFKFLADRMPGGIVQKRKFIQFYMSGFEISRMEPGDVPAEIGYRLLMQGRFLLLLWVIILGLSIKEGIEAALNN